MSKSVKIPCFIDAEVAHFDAALGDVVAEQRPMLVARCSNLSARPDQLETFAAAYLLTNILLMERISRRILKMIYVEEKDRALLTPTLNALRATFDSSFSSLEHVELWHKIVADRSRISERPLAQIQRTIAFVKGSGMMEQSEYLRRADVFFGVHGAGKAGNSPFQINDAEVFRTTIKSKTHKMDIITPEHFTAGQATYVKIEKERKIVIVDVDFTSSSWLEAWMENVGNIVDAKIYAGGAKD